MVELFSHALILMLIYDITIGFNTVLTGPFMSHPSTQLGYSVGEFQALQLIVFAAFGVVD